MRATGYGTRGQRVAKTVGAAVTHYVYDLGGNLIAEADGGTGATAAEYVALEGKPLAYIATAAIYWVHGDHLGTPQMLTDAAGAAVWDATYRPFGEATVTGALTFNLRFAGQYFDDETGLHYNYFRDYDPTTGRYIQSDPIGLSGGWNTYAYVGGNPVMLVDMFGLEYPDVSVSCDTSGPITLSVALCHYFHGGGSDLTMNFSDVDTGYMPSDFPKFKTLLKNSYKKYVNLTIPDNSYRRATDVGGAPGNMTFVLKGDFSSNPCCWEFDGYVGALNDPFDFDSKPWGVRDWWKEVGTRIYGIGDGTKFDIVFQGVRPVYQKVQW